VTVHRASLASAMNSIKSSFNLIFMLVTSLVYNTSFKKWTADACFTLSCVVMELRLSVLQSVSAQSHVSPKPNHFSGSP